MQRTGRVYYVYTPAPRGLQSPQPACPAPAPAPRTTAPWPGPNQLHRMRRQSECFGFRLNNNLVVDNSDYGPTVISNTHCMIQSLWGFFMIQSKWRNLLIEHSQFFMAVIQQKVPGTMIRLTKRNLASTSWWCMQLHTGNILSITEHVTSSSQQRQTHSRKAVQVTISRECKGEGGGAPQCCCPRSACPRHRHPGSRS